ncbi:MAG: hypothetical protein P8M80_02025 [Pirellulaceae bacterium]|nr:hypothetical protein [Pirellulaceae bacterium]
MKNLIGYLLWPIMLTGCHNHEFTLVNRGSEKWKNVTVRVGEFQWSTPILANGRNNVKVRFQIQNETGGTVSGKLNGIVYQEDFGYFTPNMPTDYHITFEDNGNITVKDAL